jgi:Protein involved in formate dehydrogenase formation
MERYSIPSTSRAPARYAGRRPSPASCIPMGRWQACAFWYAHSVRRNGIWYASNAPAAHLPRGIAYFEIGGAGGLVKAETCDQCRTYSKIVFAEKDADAEVFADDLATLALDILVDEAGWRRSTPNPFLLPGDHYLLT